MPVYKHADWLLHACPAACLPTWIASQVAHAKAGVAASPERVSPLEALLPELQGRQGDGEDVPGRGPRCWVKQIVLRLIGASSPHGTGRCICQCHLCGDWLLGDEVHISAAQNTVPRNHRQPETSRCRRLLHCAACGATHTPAAMGGHICSALVALMLHVPTLLHSAKATASRRVTANRREPPVAGARAHAQTHPGTLAAERFNT